MGRHKKENSIKSGDLGEGLQRFSFIANVEQIEILKRTARSQKVTIKKLMSQILSKYLKGDVNIKTIGETVKEITVNEKVAKNNNERLLLNFMQKKDGDRKG